MKSIEELEKYLEDECYSFAGINIGKHYVHEGIGNKIPVYLYEKYRRIRKIFGR